ncbi:methyltransferase domain-containing protein [Actinoplanes sp. KI2]|uniref:class I SAM-dependent methyltransferase n=1 Tax=Actinoplanes sp. KI2 TaxID=2983315 RepID=UPI0021D5935A|nr:class I SAM-dependent methyltransferase [Actinoplanes sp. KI2]MCU7722826.1 methyltransferase domain-containing protein [Actinoplanes sp. KI2]
MTTTSHYALRRTPEEYDRLRAQARVWEEATGRLLDRVGLAAGARCLDAGCGPGETMRLMALRVGPAGRVTGIDADAPLAAQTERMLRDGGHRQCRVIAHDLTAYESVPGGPYDLVFARLLLFHLPERVAVLRRLWQSVAPGGHLLVQDYDLAALGVLPPSAALDEAGRLIVDTFGAVGCDVRVGATLPALFARAGIGEPDGTDVAGRIEPFGVGRRMLASVLASLLPAALGHGVATAREVEAALTALEADATRHPDRPMTWPLMIGAWKRR